MKKPSNGVLTRICISSTQPYQKQTTAILEGFFLAMPLFPEVQRRKFNANLNPRWMSYLANLLCHRRIGRSCPM
ncbi:hypothetical protein PITC_064460 [Penicillium italicum]|uniref:Uncharacterized protein n=1 Tax=Penicillium italicum TaxID=40296 RepID=A0A0A2KL77_PENIT|nr:hypothetical protein PITC_064460 [Penicillium italicum]